MAKKKAPATRRRNSKATENDVRKETPIDDDPDVTTAREQLEKAREAMRAAEQQYQQVRHDAAEKIEQLRHMTVGDVVDGTMDFVRKHPGTGLVIASAVGFVFGRIFRRWF